MQNSKKLVKKFKKKLRKKKISRLIENNRIFTKKHIRLIKYFYTSNSNVQNPSKTTDIKFSTQLNSISDTNDSEPVEISASKFNGKPTLNVLHDNRFLNLSNMTIPAEVQLLLQYGEKFDLPCKQ